MVKLCFGHGLVSKVVLFVVIVGWLWFGYPGLFSCSHFELVAVRLWLGYGMSRHGFMTTPWFYDPSIWTPWFP